MEKLAPNEISNILTDMLTSIQEADEIQTGLALSDFDLPSKLANKVTKAGKHLADLMYEIEEVIGLVDNYESDNC